IPVFLNRKGSLDTAITAPPAIDVSKAISIESTNNTTSTKQHKRIVVEAKDFSKAASNEVAAEIRRLQKDPKREVKIVFATGNTMVGFLDNLSKEEGIDWKRVIAFHLDEYKGLPTTHPASFAYFLNKNLFSKVSMPEGNINYVNGANPNLKAYIEKIKALGGADIVMLGVGMDGHLAFNEPPHYSKFNSRMQEVSLVPSTIEANKEDYPEIVNNPYAYTQGMADIFEGKHLFFLANKAKKAQIVKASLEGPITEDVPASILQRHPKVTIVLDREAASLLGKVTSAVSSSGIAKTAERDLLSVPMQAHQRIPVITMGNTTYGFGLVDNAQNVSNFEEYGWMRMFPNATQEQLTDFIFEKLEGLINTVGINNIPFVGVSFGGPVDKANGIVATPFRGPLQPFERYPLVKELENKIERKYNTRLKVVIFNDAEAALRGELQPGGALYPYGYGSIMIIGTGMNLKATLRYEPYYGSHGEINELGHNLAPIKTLRSYNRYAQAIGRGKYAYLGKITRGKLPVDAYGVHIKGDLEDHCSGPNLARRFFEFIVPRSEHQKVRSYVVSKIKQMLVKEEFPSLAKSSVNNFLCIVTTQPAGLPREERRARTVIIKAIMISITELALKNEPVALRWVKSRAKELGEAIAAFMAAYPNEKFIEHIVLVSTVAEKFALGVSDKQYADVFIGVMRDAAYKALKSRGISRARAHTLASGIERSPLDYRREMIAFVPVVHGVASSSALADEMSLWRRHILNKGKKIEINKDKFFTAVEEIIKKTLQIEGRAAPSKGYFYVNEVMQRLIAAAILHWNNSHDKENPGSNIKRLSKHGRKGLFLYEGQSALSGKKIYFIARQESDGNIRNVSALYRPHVSGKRLVEAVPELFKILGIPTTKRSMLLILESLKGFKEFTLEMRALKVNFAAWLKRNAVNGNPDTLRKLVNVMLQKNSEEDAIFEINAVLEGLHRNRDPRFIGFINALPRRFRPSSLKPFELFVADTKEKSFIHRETDLSKSFLRNGNGLRFCLHPYAYSFLKDIWSKKGMYKAKDKVLFYPHVSSRTGYVRLNGKPSSHMIKVDIPARISTALRILGKTTVEEELGAAQFIARNIKNRAPPANLELILSTEAATHQLPNGITLATIARPVAASQSKEIMIPGTMLTSLSGFGKTPVIKELIRGRSRQEIERFFSQTIVQPLMQAWDYFLSMSDGQGAIGMTPELHDANFHYAYDPHKHMLLPKIIMKDFEHSRILRVDKTPESFEKATMRILETYDQLMGRLFLTPFIAMLSKVSGIAEETFDELVRDAFITYISAENRKKFLLRNTVVGCIHDNFTLLKGLSYQMMWNFSPRFRPHEIRDYNVDSGVFEKALRKEIYRWHSQFSESQNPNPVLSGSAENVPAMLDRIEAAIVARANASLPAAWKKQPLYSNEIIRRIMRVALMHWNVSSNPAKPATHFTLVAKAGNFIRNEFSAQKGLRLYQADANGKKVFFIGSLDSDGSIANCEALYVGKNPNRLRPVKNIHELLRIIGIEETQESVSAIHDSVQGYLEHCDYESKQFARNASAWLHKFRIQKITSFADLVKQVSRKHPGKPGSFILNAFFEASMLARHYAYHAYVNQLPREYRAATLGDVALNVLKIPSARVEHSGVTKNDVRLVSGGTTTLYVHPLTMSALSNAFPALKQYATDTIRFYPAISSRSGFGKQDEEWRGYHIKVDLPAFMSGWYKILGRDTVKHELDATRFVERFIHAGKVPPRGVNLFLSSEGATCHLGSGVNLATILRPIPENLQKEVLIPAAYLYSPSCCGRSMLEELLAGMNGAEIKNFFEHTLIEPVMRCWEYFLSLEDNQGALGFAPELHGANFYYLYDRRNNTLKPSIAVKDIGSEGIMHRNAQLNNGQNPSARLLNEYDHYFGYLYLAPLVNAISKITGKPESYFENIVRESFKKILTVKNRRKFLIDGNVVAMHQDPFVQLKKRNLSRTQLWVERPRFRPVGAADYAYDNLAEFKNTESVLPQALKQQYRRKNDAPKRYEHIQQLVAAYLRIKKDETNDKALKPTINEIKARKYFRSGNVAYIPRQKGTLYVISDLHGDSVSLRKILRDIGFVKAMGRGESAHIVFLGDYIHNGLRSLDVLEQVLKLKIQYPENVTLLGGTHEVREVLEWQLHQFEKWHDSATKEAAAERKNTKTVPLNSYLGLELIAEYGYENAMNIYKELVSLFDALPLVLVTGNRIVAAHGAVSRQTGISLHNLAQDSALAKEMTVNRFSENRKIDGSVTPDKKGHWVSDLTMASFLDSVGANIFVRGHQHDSAIVGALGLGGRTTVVTSSHIDSPESGYYLRSKKIKACYGVFDLERDYARIDQENIKYFTIADSDKTKKPEATTASSTAVKQEAETIVKRITRDVVLASSAGTEIERQMQKALIPLTAASQELTRLMATMVVISLIAPEEYGLLMAAQQERRLSFYSTRNMAEVIRLLRKKSNVEGEDENASAVRAITESVIYQGKRHYRLIIEHNEWLKSADLFVDILHEMTGHVAQYERGNEYSDYNRSEEAAFSVEVTMLEKILSRGQNLYFAAAGNFINYPDLSSWLQQALNAHALQSILERDRERLQYFRNKISKGEDSSSAAIIPNQLLAKRINSFFDDGYSVTYFDHPVRGERKFYGTSEVTTLRNFKGAVGVLIRNFSADKFRDGKESGSFNITPSLDGNMLRKQLSAMKPNMPRKGDGRGVLSIVLGLLLLYGDDERQREFFMTTRWGIASNFKKLTDFNIVTNPDPFTSGHKSLYEVSGIIPRVDRELLSQWRRRNEQNREKISTKERASSSANKWILGMLS
ncbi:MAG: ROK family protein, partial [Candidatus Omnitrophota bacterium]